jgi:hypothetical protein
MPKLPTIVLLLALPASAYADGLHPSDANPLSNAVYELANTPKLAKDAPTAELVTIVICVERIEKKLAVVESAQASSDPRELSAARVALQSALIDSDFIRSNAGRVISTAIDGGAWHTMRGLHDIGEIVGALPSAEERADVEARVAKLRLIKETNEYAYLQPASAGDVADKWNDMLGNLTDLDQKLEDALSGVSRRLGLSD